MSTIAKRSSFDRLANLYEQNDENDIKDDIVDCMEFVPCAESETFLIERVVEPRHTFVAAQALGRMGSTRAGPALIDLLRKAKGETKLPHWVVIDALGRSGYAPAVSVLVDRMHDYIFEAVQALGRIGTPAAYKALADEFGQTTVLDVRQTIFTALLHRREREGIRIVKELLMGFPEAEMALAPAVGYWDFDLDLNGCFNKLLPPLDDPQLMAHVVASARSVIASATYPADDAHLDGVACCACPEATQFLEEMANSATEGNQRIAHMAWQARRILAMRGHSTSQRIMAEEILSQEFNQKLMISEFGAERLGRWPRTLVRSILLGHLDRSEHTRECLDLLRWFALDEDLDLFKRFHNHEDDEIADIAHVYLQHRDAFGHSI